MADQDPDQYPATTVLRRILPTLAGYRVTKFEPTAKYKTEEELTDEEGADFSVNGIDKQNWYDIEMWVEPNSPEPEPLTKLIFVAPTDVRALPYKGVVGGNISVLIRGEVKPIGEAGKAAKIGFKAMNNANLP